MSFQSNQFELQSIILFRWKEEKVMLKFIVYIFPFRFGQADINTIHSRYRREEEIRDFFLFIAQRRGIELLGQVKLSEPLFSSR
jgi:hypothetical protein